MPQSHYAIVRVQFHALKQLHRLCAGITPARTADSLVEECVIQICEMIGTAPENRVTPPLVAALDALASDSDTATRPTLEPPEQN